jgi:hypothetical protein
MRFYSPSSSSADRDPEIYMKFHNTDNASPPTTVEEFHTMLGESTSGTIWQPNTAWSIGFWYNTGDFTNEIQAVVNRSGWSSGNTVLLILDCTYYTLESAPQENNIRVIRQRISQNNDYPLELHVAWSGGSGTYYINSYTDDGEIEQAKWLTGTFVGLLM